MSDGEIPIERIASPTLDGVRVVRLRRRADIGADSAPTLPTERMIEIGLWAFGLAAHLATGVTLYVSGRATGSLGPMEFGFAALMAAGLAWTVRRAVDPAA